MINVGVVDSNIRTRDRKEILAMQEVFPKQVKFIFMTVLPEKNPIPGVKTIYLNPKKQVEEIRKICKQYKINVLHTHNYPDTYGWWGIYLKEKTGIPVVHECHDIGYENISVDQQRITKDVMKGADFLICVSEGMSQYLHNTYGVGGKCSILYSYPNRRYIPNVTVVQKMKYVTGVYQGGINPLLVKGSSYNHRYYKHIFQALTRQGLRFNVFPASPKVVIDYQVAGVTGYKHIPDQETLFSTMAVHDFGFVGYNKTGSTVMDIALPNKLFEYISCGLPVLAMDYKFIKDFILDNKFGVVIDKDNLQLPSNYHKVMAMCRANVLKRRTEFTMERNIHKLLAVYKTVCK